jgi:hypothetical protein
VALKDGNMKIFYSGFCSNHARIGSRIGLLMNFNNILHNGPAVENLDD